VETPIYERPVLLHGNVVTGPAVVEALDTSVVSHPGYAAEVGGHGVLLLRPITSQQRAAWPPTVNYLHGRPPPLTCPIAWRLPSTSLSF
jgi:hypothetical protein